MILQNINNKGGFWKIFWGASPILRQTHVAVHLGSVQSADT